MGVSKSNSLGRRHFLSVATSAAKVVAAAAYVVSVGHLAAVSVAEAQTVGGPDSRGSGGSGGSGSPGSPGNSGGSGGTGGTGGPGSPSSWVGPDSLGTPKCFLRGTRILTHTGEVPIQNLRAGDLVCTATGSTHPVKWVGRQVFRREAGAAFHESVHPICVSRFAFDALTPHANLYVSPSHRFLFNGCLVPASYLVNGISIKPMRDDGKDVIEYFHIELETHEVIFAEGALAETLLVDGASHRENFTNFVEYERLYGPDDGKPMTPYAPVISYNGGLDELKGLLRLAVYPVIDVRDAAQVAHDTIIARSKELVRL
jgi:hypothetical protein